MSVVFPPDRRIEQNRDDNGGHGYEQKGRVTSWGTIAGFFLV
jgi:hypothetical protein